MSRNRKNVILLLLVMALASCGRKTPDLKDLQEGCYYVAQCNGRAVVLKVEDVEEKSLTGHWYVEGGALARCNHFEATTSSARRGELSSESVIVKSNAMPGGDTLVLDLLLDGSWQTLRFLPWRRPSEMRLDKPYLYHDSLYGVKCERDVVYGHAKGYWTEYPCAADAEYLPIVLEKMTQEDLTQKNWDLKMDVYRPDVNDSSPRPLLMLIHGGAFFNGYKRDSGYVEWGNYFASRGYIVVSIDYRIGFEPFGSKHIDRAGYRGVQDAYAAMCYLLRHPNQYPIDPNYLFVGGTSAGAITALNLAFMEDDDRPDCTRSGLIHDVSELYNDLADLFNERERNVIGLEDLGDINTVALQSGGDVSFKINTVINMWGAVHKIGIIGNSPSTAILSFHGDADMVVAYDYDYPFNKVKTPVRDFLEEVRSRFDGDESWFQQHAEELLTEVISWLKPLNQILCNKMYGSSEIHKMALSKGMVSELHTKKNGDHSLHVDEHGALTEYYTLITDTTTSFLYLRMFPRPTMNTDFVRRQQWFNFDNAGEWMTCQWDAEGGLVLEAGPDKARVIFFEDAPVHRLRITGKKKDEQDYCEVYDID